MHEATGRQRKKRLENEEYEPIESMKTKASPNIEGLSFEFSRVGESFRPFSNLYCLLFPKKCRLSSSFEKKLGCLPFVKKMRSSSIFEKIGVVFHF
jgi:hypothetical protein